MGWDISKVSKGDEGGLKYGVFPDSTVDYINSLECHFTQKCTLFMTKRRGSDTLRRDHESRRYSVIKPSDFLLLRFTLVSINHSDKIVRQDTEP